MDRRTPQCRAPSQSLGFAATNHRCSARTETQHLEAVPVAGITLLAHSSFEVCTQSVDHGLHRQPSESARAWAARKSPSTGLLVRSDAERRALVASSSRPSRVRRSALTEPDPVSRTLPGHREQCTAERRPNRVPVDFWWVSVPLRVLHRSGPSMVRTGEVGDSRCSRWILIISSHCLARGSTCRLEAWRHDDE